MMTMNKKINPWTTTPIKRDVERCFIVCIRKFCLISHSQTLMNFNLSTTVIERWQLIIPDSILTWSLDSTSKAVHAELPDHCSIESQKPLPKSIPPPSTNKVNRKPKRNKHYMENISDTITSLTYTLHAEWWGWGQWDVRKVLPTACERWW